MDPKNQQSSDDSQRQAAADIIRGQIDQIFIGEDGKMTYTKDQDNNPSAQSTADPNTMINSETYAKTHAPTSNTVTINADDEAKQIAAKQAYAEAHKRYHNAWQQYYQKYYERYYIAQLQSQNKRFEQGKAAIVVNDEKTKVSDLMTQSEAMDDLRSSLITKVKQGAKKARKSRHFWPAVSAAIAILIVVFIQYNQLMLAQVSAFVSPGAISEQNIIIGTGRNQPVGPEPLIVIPKINVEAPVVYGLPDLSEHTVQSALREGVVHYPIQGATSVPGQFGNTVILGHSSSDLFNSGRFKFIFVQLNRMNEGDLFYLNYEGVRYTYQVTGKEIIAPENVGKLAIGTDKPYATLITCDPPGTALRRLVVYGTQINPDPGAATQPTATGNVPTSSHITGNPPTLFERIFGN